MYHQREKLRADLYWLLGFEEDKNLSMSGPPGTWVKIIILRIVTMVTTLVMQVRRMKKDQRPFRAQQGNNDLTNPIVG